MARIKIICPICGSEDISKDASARWSVEDQRWELGGEQDCETCGNCGHESDAGMKRLTIPEIVTPWTEDDRIRAMSEGWNVVYDAYEPRNPRLIFDITGKMNDEAARAHVNHFAAQGLWFYRHALAIHHALPPTHESVPGIAYPRPIQKGNQ